jgi:hypothetical protein
MSSFQLISHRLFVAAINEENGARAKRARSKQVIDVPGPGRLASVEPLEGEASAPGSDLSAAPARAGAARC